MNREIKFRAWEKEEKRWLNKDELFISILTGQLSGWQNDESESWVLMQFTGLHDKNGKEIYEGDIVDIHNFKENWKRGEPQGNWKRFRVEWNQYTYAFNNEWIYRPLSNYDTNDLMPLEIKIVGNIYESPELLNN